MNDFNYRKKKKTKSNQIYLNQTNFKTIFTSNFI